jgi:SAM-dependent methyltransferase
VVSLNRNALRKQAKRLATKTPLIRDYAQRRSFAGSLEDTGADRETHSGYARWEGLIPLPPPALIKTTGPTTLERFFVVGDAWNQMMSPFVRAPSRVLDVGCGCGKIARFLVPNALVTRYVGFDTLSESISWCDNFIVPYAGERFEFHHFDIYSGTYNPSGSIAPTSVVFPVEDGSMSVVVAASVFTHLLEPDAQHYLRETRRVLDDAGVAILSVHTEPEPGSVYCGTEARVDVDAPYFIDLARAAGLHVRDDLGDVCGQRTFVFGGEGPAETSTQAETRPSR